jgi:hypothetical protein
MNTRLLRLPDRPQNPLRRLSILRSLPLVLFGCLWLPNAVADTIYTYDLSNVIFSDGSSATGTFTYNATLDEVTGVDIQYTSGTVGIPSDTFTSTGLGDEPVVSFGLPYGLVIEDNEEYLQLIFPYPLSGDADPLAWAENIGTGCFVLQDQSIGCHSESAYESFITYNPSGPDASLYDQGVWAWLPGNEYFYNDYNGQTVQIPDNPPQTLTGNPMVVAETAPETPEPATAVLIGTGLAALVTLRKRGSHACRKSFSPRNSE